MVWSNVRGACRHRGVSGGTRVHMTGTVDGRGRCIDWIRLE